MIPSVRRENNLRLFFAGAALATFFAILWRALPYPPVFDDFSQVVHNRAIRYLFHPRIFFENETTRARPLPYFTFALSYQLKGLSLTWLRLPGLLLHVANSALLVLYYRRVLSLPKGEVTWGALAAGVVFLLHPLSAHTAIYLSARGAVLVLVFVLLALLCHARAKQNSASWLGFLLFGFLAFLSRESAAALAPLVLLAHRRFGRSGWDIVPYLAPLAIVGLIALSIKAQYLSAAWHGFFSIGGDVDVRTATDYLRLSLSLWPRILEFLVKPGSLAIDHQLRMPASWFHPLVLGGMALWAGFAVAIVRFFRTPARWLFPVCWFFLALVPTNSIFPLLDPLSERHVYYALPAFAWLVGLGVDALSERFGTISAAASLLLVVIAADTSTLNQVLTWRSGSSLWLSAHEKAPEKFRAAVNAASSLLTERNDREGGLRVLLETLSLKQPGDVRYEDQKEVTEMIGASLATLASEQGRTPREVWESLHAGPPFWEELTLLGLERGKIPNALWESHWAEALMRVEHIPLSARANDPLWVRHSFELLRAGELARTGKTREALAEYESVILPFGTTHFPYWVERGPLGDLYMAAGRETEAEEQYELAALQYKVFKRFPVDLQQKLYLLYRNRGDLHRASDAIGELVRVFPDDPATRELYAKLLEARRDRHAMRQAGEASYYRQHAIAPGDERDMLRP